MCCFNVNCFATSQLRKFVVNVWLICLLDLGTARFQKVQKLQVLLWKRFLNYLKVSLSDEDHVVGLVFLSYYCLAGFRVSSLFELMSYFTSQLGREIL